MDVKDSETIQPALTDEEWTFPHATNVGGDDPRMGVRAEAWLDEDGQMHMRIHPAMANDGEWTLDADQRRALAALCLYQQPGGFTQEDVALLRKPHTDECSLFWLSSCMDAGSCNCGGDEKIAALADRLAALLPEPADPELVVRFFTIPAE